MFSFDLRREEGFAAPPKHQRAPKESVEVAVHSSPTALGVTQSIPIKRCWQKKRDGSLDKASREREMHRQQNFCVHLS